MPATRNRRTASVNATAGPSSAAQTRPRPRHPSTTIVVPRRSPRNAASASNEAPETISFSISDDGNPADLSDVFAAPSGSATQEAGSSIGATHVPIDAALLYAPVGAHLPEDASLLLPEEDSMSARVRFVETSSSLSPPLPPPHGGDAATYDASQSISMDQGGASWIEEDSHATGDTTQEHDVSRRRPRLNFTAPGRSARLFLGLESSHHMARTVRDLSPATDRASVMSLPLDPYVARASFNDAFAPAVAHAPAVAALHRQYDARRKLQAQARLADKAQRAADRADNLMRRKRVKLLDLMAVQVTAAAKKPTTSKSVAARNRDEKLRLSLWKHAGVETMIRCTEDMHKAEAKINKTYMPSLKRTLGKLTSDFDSDMDDWHFLNHHHPQRLSVDAVFSGVSLAKLTSTWPVAGVGKGAEQWCNSPGSVHWGGRKSARTGVGVLLLHEQMRGLSSRCR